MVERTLDATAGMARLGCGENRVQWEGGGRGEGGARGGYLAVNR